MAHGGYGLGPPVGSTKARGTPSLSLPGLPVFCKKELLEKATRRNEVQRFTKENKLFVKACPKPNSKVKSDKKTKWRTNS